MNGDQNPEGPATGWQFHPGDTVTPAVAQPVTSAPAPAASPAPLPQQPAAVAPTQPVASAAPAPVQVAEVAPAQTLSEPIPEVPAVSDDQVSWTASEYIAHQKSFGWYALLALAALVLAGLTYLFSRDLVSTGLLVVIVIIFGMYGGRKPRTLPYSVDSRGVQIGQRFYAYGQFRSFSVMQEGPFSSIVLMPLRRFMPLMTIYYEPQDEDKIVKVVADHLPLAPHKRDAIDNFMHKIRF